MLLGGSINEDATAAFAREIWDLTQNQMPQEKAQMVRDMAQTGRELQAHGSDKVDGRGQMMCSIPPRIYMRWAQMVPGFWQSKPDVDEFLADNPQLCAVGYRPKAKNLRNGFTFVGGQPVRRTSLYKANKSKVTAALAAAPSEL